MLFPGLLLKENYNSHIAPKYIYRGISKRYFTESVTLNDIIESFDDKKSYIFNEIDITEVYCNEYLTAKDKFEQYSKEHPYNNSHEIVNGMHLDELKIQKKTEYFYENIYKRLKQRFEELIKGNDENLPCEQNILRNIQLLKELNNWFENTLTKSEQIRSGASVRLRDTDKNISL